jgi:hypothetical protein
MARLRYVEMLAASVGRFPSHKVTVEACALRRSFCTSGPQQRSALASQTRGSGASKPTVLRKDVNFPPTGYRNKVFISHSPLFTCYFRIKCEERGRRDSQAGNRLKQATGAPRIFDPWTEDIRTTGSVRRNAASHTAPGHVHQPRKLYDLLAMASRVGLTTLSACWRATRAISKATPRRRAVSASNLCPLQVMPDRHEVSGAKRNRWIGGELTRNEYVYRVSCVLPCEIRSGIACPTLPRCRRS